MMHGHRHCPACGGDYPHYYFQHRYESAVCVECYLASLPLPYQLAFHRVQTGRRDMAATRIHLPRKSNVPSSNVVTAGLEFRRKRHFAPKKTGKPSVKPPAQPVAQRRSA